MDTMELSESPGSSARAYIKLVVDSIFAALIMPASTIPAGTNRSFTFTAAAIYIAEGKESLED